MFVNIEDKVQIDEVDIASREVTRCWPLAPGTAPTGLAIDVEHNRLFSGCRSGVMAISDTVAGKQTVKPMEGARTTELDPAPHTPYTASAKFGARPGGRGRPPVLPNSFTVQTLTR